MLRYLSELERTTGISHSCLCTLGEITDSTFPAVLRYSLERACALLDQLFTGLLAEEGSDQEICIELEHYLIIVVPLRCETFLLLLADTPPNLIVLRAAIKALKQKYLILNENVSEAEPPLLTLRIDHPELLNKSEISLLLVRLRKVFADYLGRAAYILFSQIAERWQQQYPPTRDSVFILLEMLGNLIEDPDECYRFMRQIELIQQQTLEIP